MIRSRWDANIEADELVDEARGRLDDARALNSMEVKRLKKLGAGYFWDPIKKQVVKKVGSVFQFVRHDRRGAARGAGVQRRFKSVTGGLLWDLVENKLYRKQGEHYILYSPDRRKKRGRSPSGAERRRS